MKKSLRSTLLPFLLFLSATCSGADPVRVILETDKGMIEIEVIMDQAPISAASILTQVDAGQLDKGGF